MNKESTLTYAQARTLCAQFQHLLGKPFDPLVMGKGTIECVAIAPYEQSHKWMFAQVYKECRDAQKALGLYKHTAFDVVLLAFPLLRKRGVNFIELRKYLAMYYNEPGAAAYRNSARI